LGHDSPPRQVRQRLANSDAVYCIRYCCAESAVRDFLDSRHGRHFADDVANELFDGCNLPNAIATAVERWMSWTVGRCLSRETGIPRGLPYLVGFVTDCEIMADDAP